MKKLIALFAVVAMIFSLTACSQPKKMVYAVEAGSAGEAIAKEKGYQINSVENMAAALMEVQAGTSNAASSIP